MSIEEIKAFVDKNMRNSPMIDSETALKALKTISKNADKKNIPWALVGGVAMSFYGSPRLTQDVDVISSATVGIEAERKLGFGGERYQAKVGKKTVPVDWIVRNDTAKKFYEKALTESTTLYDIPIITPEWLVILKYIAGRFKDQQDAVYLLKKKKLVDRKLIRKKIIETAGPEFWAIIASGLKRWYDLADGKITTEKEDYEADRL